MYTLGRQTRPCPAPPRRFSFFLVGGGGEITVSSSHLWSVKAGSPPTCNLCQATISSSSLQECVATPENRAYMYCTVEYNLVQYNDIDESMQIVSSNSAARTRLFWGRCSAYFLIIFRENPQKIKVLEKISESITASLCWTLQICNC